MDGNAAIEAPPGAEAQRRGVVDMARLGEPAPSPDKLADVGDSPLTASLRSAPLPLEGERRGRNIAAAISSPPLIGGEVAREAGR